MRFFLNDGNESRARRVGERSTLLRAMLRRTAQELGQPANDAVLLIPLREDPALAREHGAQLLDQTVEHVGVAAAQ